MQLHYIMTESYSFNQFFLLDQFSNFMKIIDGYIHAQKLIISSRSQLFLFIIILTNSTMLARRILNRKIFHPLTLKLIHLEGNQYRPIKKSIELMTTPPVYKLNMEILIETHQLRKRLGSRYLNIFNKKGNFLTFLGIVLNQKSRFRPLKLLFRGIAICMCGTYEKNWQYQDLFLEYEQALQIINHNSFYFQQFMSEETIKGFCIFLMENLIKFDEQLPLMKKSLIIDLLSRYLMFSTYTLQHMKNFEEFPEISDEKQYFKIICLRIRMMYNAKRGFEEGILSQKQVVSDKIYHQYIEEYFTLITNEDKLIMYSNMEWFNIWLVEEICFFHKNGKKRFLEIFGKIINYENFYVHPENGKWKIILALLKYFDYGDKKEMIGILRNLQIHLMFYRPPQINLSTLSLFQKYGYESEVLKTARFQKLKQQKKFLLGQRKNVFAFFLNYQKVYERLKTLNYQPANDVYFKREMIDRIKVQLEETQEVINNIESSIFEETEEMFKIQDNKLNSLNETLSLKQAQLQIKYSQNQLKHRASKLSYNHKCSKMTLVLKILIELTHNPETNKLVQAILIKLLRKGRFLQLIQQNINFPQLFSNYSYLIFKHFPHYFNTQKKMPLPSSVQMLKEESQKFNKAFQNYSQEEKLPLIAFKRPFSPFLLDNFCLKVYSEGLYKNNYMMNIHEGPYKRLIRDVSDLYSLTRECLIAIRNKIAAFRIQTNHLEYPFYADFQIELKGELYFIIIKEEHQTEFIRRNKEYFSSQGKVLTVEKEEDLMKINDWYD